MFRTQAMLTRNVGTMSAIHAIVNSSMLQVLKGPEAFERLSLLYLITWYSSRSGELSLEVEGSAASILLDIGMTSILTRC